MKNSAPRLWLTLFGIGFAVLAALLVLTLWTPPAYGGLTRIGRVSEHAFGWRSVPPDIPARFVRNDPLKKADVLVIGDSFSMYFAWQASLVQAGYRVTSAHWDKMDPLCEDFGAWLRQAGFRGGLVVIESVERLLPQRLEGMRSCRTMGGKAFVPHPAPAGSPSAPPPPSALNWASPLFTGVLTYRNTRQIARSDGVHAIEHEQFGDAIFSAPLKDGCEQFSNRMCGKGLFLSADRDNPALSAADAEFMNSFSQKALPLRVPWMFIPNKTTVYLDTRHAQGFVDRANALQLGLDLFALSQWQRRKMIDLYWPNDTHWSMQGQKYFGEQMLATVRNAIGPAPGSATP